MRSHKWEKPPDARERCSACLLERVRTRTMGHTLMWLYYRDRMIVGRAGPCKGKK